VNGRRLVAAAALICGLAAVPVWAEDRALLVGIDHYEDSRVPATPGAVLDAKGLAEVVHDRFGFPQASIKLLLDKDASADRIVQELQSWLIAGSQPGDRVFFFYAGHGSQLPDDNGDEEDGTDETLAPFDVQPTTGGHEIRDDAIGGLIAQLSGRRAVLIFDSCHSGTITRGLPTDGELPQGGGARYLPPPQEFQKIWETGGGYRTRGEAPSYVLSAVPGGGKSFLADSRKLGRLSGIVAISAAGPGGLAYPIKIGGQYRGALSYLIQEIYTDANFSRSLFDDIGQKVVTTTGGAVKGVAQDAVTGGHVSLGTAATSLGQGITLGALETTVDAGMKRLRQSGQLQGSQQPWFEVISEHPLIEAPLFGTWEQAPAVALSNPVADQRVKLSAVDNRTVFTRGEKLVFDVTSDRPGYLYLLVFSEGKVATCIYPNPDDPDNAIAAGTKRLPASARYVFPVQEPFGRDVVVALVSQERKHLCEKVTYTWDEVFARAELSSVQEDLHRRSQRGVGVQSVAGVPLSQGERWQAAALVVETRPAPGDRP
jgi:hypothetical protein